MRVERARTQSGRRRHGAADSWRIQCVVALALSAGMGLDSAQADGPTAAESLPGEAETAEREEEALAARQQALASRYQRFEHTLLQLFQYLRKTDPARAELLGRAIGQSTEQRISSRLAAVARLLSEEDFGRAAEAQEQLVAQLRALMTLLQSEDRLSELDRERERLRDLIKDLGRIIGKQKDIRAGTERGGEFERLAERQGEVAGDAGRLADKMAAQDAQKSGEAQPGGEPSDQPPPEGETPGGPSQKRTPGREEIEQARRLMQQARQQLQQKQRREAAERQDQALEHLQTARDNLEEMLRQMREEERGLMLAALEARFQKMLALQAEVYNGTVELARTPPADWSARHDARADELGAAEEEIVREAERALALLKEDGSSTAFPEAVQQLLDDMRTVARQLFESRVDEFTQALERDILEGLEEMVRALQKEMEQQAHRQRQPPGSPQAGEPSDPDLVDMIAELKMLRSLQVRINRRTTELGRLIEGEQATDPSVVQQLQALAARQARVQQAAYNLAAGRNR